MEVVKGFVITANGLVSSGVYDAEKYPLPSPDEVQVCQSWIEKFAKRTKHINRETYSYSLKHRVERWSGSYVSNGAFILAALNMGYEFYPFQEQSPNVVFNMRLFLPENAWKRVRAAAFSRWLFKQKELDTPIGDLARDAIEDDTWPRKAKRFIDFRLYLESVGASTACLRTLTEAWVACYEKKPPYPDFQIQERCEKFYNGECDIIIYGDTYQKAPDGKTYIYVLFESREDCVYKVRYVGQTIDPTRRLKEHITCPGNIEKVIWTAKLLEAGRYPGMGVIEMVDKKDAVISEETYIIAFGDCERKPDQSISEVLFNVQLL
jgi:uncharacterized protein YozE (UPF0346 family)